MADPLISKNAQSARKGKATEQLIAATCVLATGGELNALTALVDDEGVDLGFKRRNGSRTLDVQVKARFADQDGSKALREKGTFSSDVREITFQPRDDLAMLYVAVNGPSAEIIWAWLVPSAVLHEEAIRIQVRGETRLRFAASAKPDTDDKWRPYRLTRAELPSRLLDAVAALEPEPIADDHVEDEDEDG